MGREVIEVKLHAVNWDLSGGALVIVGEVGNAVGHFVDSAGEGWAL